MPRLTRAFPAALLFPLAACSANPPESHWAIELVAGGNCGACSLFEEVREERGIGDVLEPEADGLPDRVPIRVVSPDVLSDDDFRAMDDLPYLEDSEARNLIADGSMLVVVRRGGRIEAAGNISWSTNLPAARFPTSIMRPPAEGPFAELTSDPVNYYETFFREHWSLEHFLKLARDPSLAKPRTFAEAYEPSRAASDYALGAANVFIVGNASTPAGNSLFIPERIREIREALSGDLSVPPEKVQIFFGDGGGITNDTSFERQGKLRFRPVNLGGERSLDGQAVVDWFAALREQETEHNLIVMVGHGAPWGMPVWGHLAPLAPDEMAGLLDAGYARNVIVSGACFGGIFAESASCGFFAARPDVVAAGCQRSPEAIAQSDDYPRWYFRSLDAEFRDEADADRDGAVSFEEAHWFAATRLEHDQIPYTTLDALADRYFAAHPSRLPVSVTPGALESLARDALPAERRALERLTEHVADGRAIDLTDPAEQMRRAAGRLEGLADASSAARNEAMELPYRLALVQLARRLVYRDALPSGEANEMHRVQACGATTIEEFLNR